MVDEITGLKVPQEIASDAERVAREVADQLRAEPIGAPSSLIPFDEFERRIRVLRENGVRIYQDNIIKVQIDTYKRQPDPVPLAHETQST